MHKIKYCLRAIKGLDAYTFLYLFWAPFLVTFYLNLTKLVKTPAKKRKMGLKLIRVKRIKKTLVNLQPMGT